ncbi:MAG TPA: glutamate-cysteine ligase family protein [Longimicrobiales bacterium]|nr:glutamate-cysteine ligase family protein [Longimicrobiales bacterium]
MSCSLRGSAWRQRLIEDVAARLFSPPPGRGQGTVGDHGSIGAEVELLPLRADDGRPVPIVADETGPGSMGFLEPLARSRGWRVEPGPHGAPNVSLPAGGVISFEPGGQIEYASPPHGSVGELVADLDRVVPPLVEAAAEAGVRLVGAGIDPVNPLARARLLLPGSRYQVMHRYLSALGEAGPRMMLQTAALQVNVDLGDTGGPDAHLRWRVLNAAAPYLTAIFANAGVYAGADTGCASFRALQWRRLDTRRTGLLGRAPDAAAEYTDFALEAGWMFGPDERPFADHMLEGRATLDDWRTHLTTLFPEVRPRGFLEIRGVDALPPEWLAAPAALVAGLLADPVTLLHAADLLGRPDPLLLHDAASAGLREPRLAGPARELFGLALQAGERTRTLTGRARDVAWRYFERFTARGLSPADGEVGAAA